MAFRLWYDQRVIDLNATSIDRDLRHRTASGHVLSVYDRAAYFKDGGRELIVVAHEAVGSGPGYVLIAGDDWPQAGCRPGDPFDLKKLTPLYCGRSNRCGFFRCE